MEIGSRPSLAPTTWTTGHSRPLAACTEARVTPSTTGADCASARSSSSRTTSASPVPGRARTVSARPTRALRESQRSRTAPVVAGGCGFQPCWERSEEHMSELQSRGQLVCRLLLEKKKASLQELVENGE